MRLLALSTSGPVASAALLADGRIAAEATGEAGRAHSETLLEAVSCVLQQSGCDFPLLDGFAVDVGPGSFTGVRIGVATANAFGKAQKKPVYAVSSLEAMAFGWRGSSVCALLDARNGNGYAALYQAGACVFPPAAVVIEELLQNTPPDTLFLGDWEKHRALIEATVLRPAFAESGGPTASGVALFSFEHPLCAAEEALPLYLRPSQAERMKLERERSN